MKNTTFKNAVASGEKVGHRGVCAGGRTLWIVLMEEEINLRLWASTVGSKTPRKALLIFL